ncbi:MAG: carboxypeptidase-like regulatory domain-containing protein [Planctomycetaceae bacterium]|jgi:hypothetical protein|nr:carboxypeptidase-like regulatory domain-containing protein [Planctomycetaceae bacterium]
MHRFFPFLFIVLLAGCSQSGRLSGLVPAQGVVKFNGEVVAGADITFSPSGDARPGTATTDASGKFSLMTLNPGDGIYPGEYTVTVKKTEVTGEYKRGRVNGKFVAEDTRQYIEHLPAKYGAITTSDIKLTISPKGDKNIEINLAGEVSTKPAKLPQR